VLQYYDVLEPPPNLPVTDALYVNSRTLVDYFRVLREINKVLVNHFCIHEAFKNHVAQETTARKEYLDARKRFDELLRLRERYQTILKASTGTVGPTSSNEI
jgi:hypothetical protein